MTKAIYDYIITPDEGKVLKDRTTSGVVLHTMMGDQDGRFLNRIGDVIHAPIHNSISAQKGDKILVSHGTFRKWQEVDGTLNHSNMIGEGNYFQSTNEIYAYKQDDIWYSTNNWIFVDPVDHVYSAIKGVETLRPDKGTIVFEQDPKFNNDQVSTGDFVTFRTGKYVTTIVDGKTYYRIMGKHILLNHGPHKD